MQQLSARVSPLALALFALSLIIAFIITQPLYQPLLPATYPVVLVFLILGYLRPYWGLVAWLCCVPWYSMAKWTGAMVIEEYDLALWGYCIGLAIHLLRVGLPGNSINIKWHSLVMFLLLLALGWQIAAIINGFQSLPVNSAVFFTNYEDQGGPLRIAKSIFSAMCFYACCRYLSADWQRFQHSIIYGFAFGVTAVVLGCLFERWHFTGLLNLTADYRTTAWFWEMHTGGATLDAYLALSLPFLLTGLCYGDSSVKKGVFALLLAGYGYVALTTFSRGVYISVLLVTVLFLAVHYHKRYTNGLSLVPADKHRFYSMLGVSLLSVIAAVTLFPYGGYRVLLAISGLLLLLLFLIGQAYSSNLNATLTGFIAAAVLMGAGCFLFGVGHSVYFAYALCWFAALTCMIYKQKRAGNTIIDMLLGCFLMLLALLTIAICWYWSDYMLTGEQLPALVLVPLLLIGLLLPFNNSNRIALSVSLSLWTIASGLCLLLAMFFNSSYIESRFSTTDKDLLGRFQHWQNALEAMPETNDFWFGSGVGRFVQLNRARGDTDDQVAILSILPLKQGNILYLKSGSHVHGYGELFRLTQQISRPIGDVTLQLAVRHSNNISLLAEICDKQLLYHGKCARGTVSLKGQSNEVMDYTIHFKDNPFSTELTDNLMSKTFSLAINKPDTEIAIESIQLSDSRNKNLLDNSDFSKDMQYWFFSSDRHHMPYHVKGLWPMQFFEMGLIGLLLWNLLTIFVCGRQLFTTDNFSNIGSAVAMSLIGLLLVGLFDSVIDGGRMAMLYLILILLAGGIRKNPYEFKTKEITGQLHQN